jgi:glycosyltransferase involved in cell wall biosynthesis
MRILFLSPVLPHAQVVSGMINVYQRIKLLSRMGHEVGLACFTKREDQSYLPALRPLLYEFEMLPQPSQNYYLRPDWFDRIFNPLPQEFRRAFHPAMQRLVGQMVDRSHYDVVIAEFTIMGQYLYRNPWLSAVRRVISCHSCLSAASRKAFRMRPYTPEALARRLVWDQLNRYEFALYRSADLVLTLTAEERMELLRHDPDLRVGVVPYGVDVDFYKPHPSRPAEEAIVYTGYFAQEPNRDAFNWFIRMVWPGLKARHPQLKFYVVGQGVTPDMLDAARRDPNLVITGAVDDVSPYLNRARVYVCPIRLGSGFRGKVLQAMAAGIPVVATTLAAEGIPAQTGHNILLADTPHTMGESINLLLQDGGLRRTIAANARDMVVRRFAWKQCVDRLDLMLRGMSVKHVPVPL